MAHSRGRVERGPGATASDHDHPDYLTFSGHDQIIHEQHNLPSKTETGEAFDSATSGTTSKNTIVSTTITVPDWAAVANVMVNGQADVTSATSDEVIIAQVTIDGDAGPNANGHFHSTFPDSGSVSPSHVHSVTSPGSSITVTLDAQANGETVTADVSWLVVFERFE